MTDNDNILVERFFREVSTASVEDNGFTRRVMTSLPSRTEKLVRMWTVLCVAVSVVLFFVFYDWQIILVNIEVFLRTLPTVDLSLSIIMNVLVIFIAIVSTLAYTVISRERLSF